MKFNFGYSLLIGIIAGIVFIGLQNAYYSMKNKAAKSNIPNQSAM